MTDREFKIFQFINRPIPTSMLLATFEGLDESDLCEWESGGYLHRVGYNSWRVTEAAAELVRWREDAIRQSFGEGPFMYKGEIIA